MYQPLRVTSQDKTKLTGLSKFNKVTNVHLKKTKRIRKPKLLQKNTPTTTSRDEPRPSTSRENN